MSENTDDRLCKAIEKLNLILMGNGKLGLISKVEIMWRGGIWLLMVVMMAVGTVFGYYLDRVF